MGVVAYILTFIVLALILRSFGTLTKLSLKAIYGGWIIKVLLSVAFVFIFSNYYGNGSLTGDAFNFIRDSQLIKNYAAENPAGYFQLLTGLGPNDDELENSVLAYTHIWSYGDNGDFINDNRLIIRINSIIHFFSWGNAYVHALVMTFLSFIGILLLYRTFSEFTTNKKLFFWVLLCMPSLAFWSSGITKESILILGLGLFFYCFFSILKRVRVSVILGLCISILILLLNKPYVGLVVISLTPLLIIGHYIQWNKKLLYFFPVGVILISIFLVYAPGPINLLNKVSYKQRDLINIGKGGIFFVTDSSFCAFDYAYLDNFEFSENETVQVLSKTPGTYKLFGEVPFYPFEMNPSDNSYDVYLVQIPSTSFIETIPINYSGANLVRSIPENIINTTLRPFPSDPGSNLKHFSFISNILLIGLLITAFIFRKKRTCEENYILSYLFMASVITLLLIGWTTPILGAIVRYKIAAELFLIIAAFILLKPFSKKTL